MTIWEFDETKEIVCIPSDGGDVKRPYKVHNKTDGSKWLEPLPLEIPSQEGDGFQPR